MLSMLFVCHRGLQFSGISLEVADTGLPRPGVPVVTAEVLAMGLLAGISDELMVQSAQPPQP